ncbi:MAG TPA: hypothetical protein VHX65_07620 [Pirellulales bacterium]|nr:hypothetical protein [Pirellulales bacterium]
MTPCFCGEAEAYRGGHPRGDADIIIAATALESNWTLVTGDIAHFGWIPGLVVAARASGHCDGRPT